MSAHLSWTEYREALAHWTKNNTIIDPSLRDPQPLPPALLPRSRIPLPDTSTSSNRRDSDHPQILQPTPATARSRRPPASDTLLIGSHVLERPPTTWTPQFSFSPPDTNAFDLSFASPPFQYVSPEELHSSSNLYQGHSSPAVSPPPLRRRQRSSSTLIRNTPLPSLSPEPETSSAQVVAPPGRYYLRSISKAKKAEPLVDENVIVGASGPDTQPKTAARKKGVPRKTNTEDVETTFGVAVFAGERNEKGQAKVRSLHDLSGVMLSSAWIEAYSSLDPSVVSLPGSGMLKQGIGREPCPSLRDTF